MSIAPTENHTATHRTPPMYASAAIRFILPILITATMSVGCATGPARAPIGDSFIKYVSFEAPGHENVLLRWQKRRMPLKVHMTPPPAGLFDNPDAIQDSVRSGILDWENTVAPNVPSFEFVDDQGDADIPIVWAEDPKGGWFIAHCVWEVDILARRFGVARILVTGRWGKDKTASMHDIHEVVLHEMGHALGMGGHSPDPEDIMYRSQNPYRQEPGLTERDVNTLRALYQMPNGRRITGARSADQ